MFTAQSVIVDKPIAEVFDFVADVANFAKWLHKTKVRAEYKTPGIVGSTWEQESMSGGVRFRFWNTVTACERPVFFSYKAVTNVTVNQVAIHFHDMGGRTRVDTEWEMRGSRWYLRAVFACIAQERFRARMAFESQRHLQGLKRALEHPNADPGEA